MGKWTNKKTREFMYFYHECELPLRATAEKMGITRKTLQYYVNKLALPKRTRGEAISVASKNGRFNHVKGKNNCNYIDGRAMDKTTRRVSQYGLTVEEYRTMIEDCNNSCEVCNKAFGDKNPHIDHCHDSGAVRGLLCSNCNTGIGMLGDNQDSILKAYNYLEKSKFRWDKRTK